jgi:hypothetical protein
MDRSDKSAFRSWSAVDGSAPAWWVELRSTVLPALIDEDAVWISLVESGAEVREPVFAGGAVTLELLEASRPESWRCHLASVPRTVIVDLLSLRTSSRYAASLLGAARAANPGGTIALIAAAAQVNSYSGTQLRSLLVNEFSVEWIVWCDSKRSPLSLVIVVVRAQPSADAVTRLVDGRGAELVEVVGLIESCGRRSGGRVGRAAVYRGTLPTDQRWTWWEFSPEAAAEREDVRAFGDARPLGEIADIIFRPARRLTITEIEEGELAADHVGIVSGARIGPDGELSFPVQHVPRTEINDQDLLREGDCVVAAFARQHLRIAVVPAGGPPLIPHATIVVVRFRSSIGATERSAILAYLRSGRFAREVTSVSSTSIGDHLRVTPRNLREALVPRFSDAFLEAWQRARDARQQLRAWADEVDDASFFDASSMRAELPAFLERSRAIRDRVAAGAELDTIEGRIRMRYPHPLAVRYENAGQMEHGVERIRETLACAEHLVLFLAFLGVVNLGRGRVGSLAAWTDARGLRLDWGKADTLLREAVAKAAHERDRLQRPIPELATMHEAFVEPRSDLNQACGELRRWRNDESHLARGLAGEVIETSTRFAGHLRVLFEAAALLTQTPLLAVEDYKRDPHSEEPCARFAYVVGVSAAFRRQWERVEAELTREHLVVRDVHGKHHSLHPWLIRRVCSECHHSETFVLSRFDQDHATYVAMESGHVLSDPTLSQVLANLVRANSR